MLCHFLLHEDVEDVVVAEAVVVQVYLGGSNIIHLFLEGLGRSFRLHQVDLVSLAGHRGGSILDLLSSLFELHSPGADK